MLTILLLPIAIWGEIDNKNRIFSGNLGGNFECRFEWHILLLLSSVRIHHPGHFPKGIQGQNRERLDSNCHVARLDTLTHCVRTVHLCDVLHLEQEEKEE